MTRLKLALVWLLVVGGSLALFVWQFREGLRHETYGNPLLNSGPLWDSALALVIASIPVIFFAVSAWLALSWLLFRPGEIEDYKARRRVARLRKSHGDMQSVPRSSKTPGHVFDDE